MSTTFSESHFITTKFGNIFSQIWTPPSSISDTPVVLLHDSLGCIALWRDFPQILAEKLRRPVIAYDRLGFGRSDARHDIPGIDFIQEEASLYFPPLKAALELKHYILFGYSVGGAMAANIAAIDKDCQALITMSAQAFVEQKTIEGILEAKTLFQQPGQIEKLQKWHGDKAKWVLDAWTETWTAPEFQNWNLKNCCGKIHCPILAIHGDKDEYGSAAFPAFITQCGTSKSETLLIENCGHMPQKSHPNALLTKTAEFLNYL